MKKKEEVKHIAKLARLALSEKELEKYQKELSSILDYIEKLKKVDVSEVEPTSHPIKVENIVREDKGKSPETEIKRKLSQQMPGTKDGYLKVKSIL